MCTAIHDLTSLLVKSARLTFALTGLELVPHVAVTRVASYNICACCSRATHPRIVQALIDVITARSCAFVPFVARASKAACLIGAIGLLVAALAVFTFIQVWWVPGQRLLAVLYYRYVLKKMCSIFSTTNCTLGGFISPYLCSFHRPPRSH